MREHAGYSSNRPDRPTFAKKFTKTAHGRVHGLRVIDRGPGTDHKRDPAAPPVVVCEGLGFRRCGRKVDADMMVAYGGRWICDGCEQVLVRNGLLVEAEIDVEPGE